MITITEKAKDKITERLGGAFLRLSLSGGGCSGYQYKWGTTQEPRDNDHVIEESMVIDDLSMSYLWGSIVDYYDTISGSGFEVHNPNAVGMCGCGVSVSFK